MRRAARRVACALGVAAGLGAPARALAGPQSEAAAEALFIEGREAMKRRDYRLACTKLEASQELDPGVGTLLNLAHCKEGLGDVVAAWQHLRTAVAQLEASPDERLGFARARLDEVERRLPRLTIRLDPSAPPGTRVTCDGVELPAGSLGSPLPQNPGEHSLGVSAPGFGARRLRVSLVEGERKAVVVGPGSADPSPSAQRLWGWVGVGFGAAAVAAGAVAGVVALQADARLDTACAPAGGSGARVCPASSEGDLGTFRVARSLSWVGFGLGTAALGLGLGLQLTAPEKASEARRASRPALDARPRFDALIAPGFAGLRAVF